MDRGRGDDHDRKRSSLSPCTDHRRSADVLLDITLYFEIALLAAVLLMWNPPVRPFPSLFLPATHAVQP
jgi:hypothetical protein